MFEPNTALGIVEIVLIAIAAFVGLWHGALKELSKQHRRAKKEEVKINQEITDELNVKNIGKMGGSFAADYVQNFLTNLEKDLVNTKAEMARVQTSGVVTEETTKQINALQGKIKQITWFMEHRETLMTLNSQFVPAVVQRLADRKSVV